MSLIQQHSLGKQNSRWWVFWQELELFASYCLAHLIVWRTMLTPAKSRAVLNSATQTRNERVDEGPESQC